LENRKIRTLWKKKKSIAAEKKGRLQKAGKRDIIFLLMKMTCVKGGGLL